MVVCGIGVFVYYLVYAPATDARDIIFALAVAALAVVITERSWTVLCDESFGLFALVVGVVIVAVGLSVTYLETIERPSVRPAAVAFNDSRRGIAGLFIAESSTTIYIAEVEPKTDNHDEGDEPTGRMIEIPRDRIRALTIGSSQSLPQAITRAPTLLTELNVLVPKK